MPEPTSDLIPSTAAAARAADSLLRQNGGRQVLLRLPSPATPGDSAEQLGLATPGFQDLPLAPAVFRKARVVVTPGKPSRWELLVSATTVEDTVGSLAFDSASILFAQAAGVVINQTLYEIEALTTSEAFGAPYLYRLTLRLPLTQLT